MTEQTIKFSGAKIRQARHEKGWSQAELAYRAGVRERQVIRWENDQHEPRIDGITKIAAATGKDVGDFMADSNGAASSSPEEDEAALLLRHAHELDMRGDYALADDLRTVARRRRVAA